MRRELSINRRILALLRPSLRTRFYALCSAAFKVRSAEGKRGR